MADGDIGQDALQDNQAAGEGDGYPVTGNAELDRLLRHLPTDLAYECLNGPSDRDVFGLIYNLVTYLTPDEIFRLRELGGELTPAEKAYREAVGEDQNAPPARGATLLSEYLFGLHEKELRSCIVQAIRERYADNNGPIEFSEMGFFVVRHLGAAPAVCRFNKKGELEAQNYDNFKKSYIEKKHRYLDPKSGKPRIEPAAKVWLETQTNERVSVHSDPIIKRYSHIEFLPDREASEGVLNLWRGWPEGCRSEDVGQPDDEHRCAMMLEHIEQNICGGDMDLARWFLGFLRDMIINPGVNRPIAVLMNGPQGSGKGMFCRLIGQWFGVHFCKLSNADQFFARFNAHISAKIMIFLDEPKGKDLQREASLLKTMVSEPTVNIERKWVDLTEEDKFFRVFAASNDEHIAHIDKDDRRYLILNVDAGKNNNNSTYFGALKKEWENGGREAMFRWLRDDVEGLFDDWDWNKRPVTKGLQEQKNLSLDPVNAALRRMLDEGTLPPMHKHLEGGSVFVATESFMSQYGLNSGPGANATATAVGKLLSAIGTGQAKHYFEDPRHAGQRRQFRGYVLPPLAKCRENWAALLEREMPWTNDDHDWGDGIPF